MRALSSTLLAVVAAWTGVILSSNAQLVFTHIGGGATGTVTPNAEPGSITLVGGGQDIWDGGDEFDFYQVAVAGDFDLRVKVDTLQASARWTKAGVMARESLNPDSRMAFSKVSPFGPTAGANNPGAADVSFMYRTWIPGAGGNGGQHEDRLVPDPGYPGTKWVRLQRTGNLMNGYASVDGETWSAPQVQDTANWLEPVGGVPTPFTPSSFIGLAVSRHPDSSLPTAQAEFRNYANVVTDPAAIVRNPVDATVGDGQSVSFSFEATGGYDSPTFAIQWKRNGSDIGGANSRVYTIPAAALADSGASYSAEIRNTINSTVATSSGAVLTVIADNTAPTLVSAASGSEFTPFDKVVVVFSEAVSAATAEESFNYAIAGVTVNSASLQADGRTVILTTTSQSEGTTYSVVVNDITDRSSTPNTIAPNSSASFSTRHFVPAHTTRQHYFGFGGSVDDFINSASRPPADYSCLTNIMEVNHADIADNYIGRLVGYFVPTETGPHRFFISSDDQGRLFLSTDENPANKTIIAREPEWNGRRDWNGTARRAAADNISAPINLVAGNRYFIESFMKEGGGGDNMAVAVQKPSEANPPPNGSLPVNGGNLGVYASLGGGTVSITGNPANRTVFENASASFSVTANGSSTQCGGFLTYQWTKNGVVIPGANGSSVTIGPVTVADDGAVISARAIVPGAVAVSQNATLTVLVDNEAPLITTVVGSATFDQVTVNFSELMNLAALTETFNYSINGGAISVSAVTVVDGGRAVILTTDPQSEDTDYTIELLNMTDLAGNALANPMQTFHSFVSVCGGVEFSIYNQVGGGTDINLLVNHPSFPNSPNEVRRLQTYDTGADFAENYGGRVRGLFIPPVSGAWNLFVTADDGSRLFFNPNGPNAAGKVLISEETPGCCTAFAGRQAGPFNLVAGQGYYLEGIYKEAGGGDYIRVAARLASDNSTPLAPMPPAWAGFPAAPPGIGGPLAITQQPVTQIAEENKDVTFSVTASNPNGLPFCYQWKRNGIDIPGANNRVLALRTDLSQNGDRFSVEVGVIGSKVLSDQAILAVIPDRTSPTCVEARGSASLTKVTITFSEQITPATANESFNYSVPGFVVNAAELDATGTKVTLTLDGPQTPGTTYTVSIQDVADLVGNVISPNPCVLTFQSFVVSCGFAIQELYQNIGGVNVVDLTSNPAYPNSPSSTSYVPLIEGPLNAFENYGTRITGFIVAPVSGNYNFFMSSDDGGQLMLSTDANPANLVLIAREPVWNGSRDYQGTARRNAAAPENRSASLFPGGIPLVAGQMYAFEAIGKEGGGGDNLAVAWQLPGGAAPANGSLPISGGFLAALADPVGSSVTIGTQPVDLTVIENTTAAFTVAATGQSQGQPAPSTFYQWDRMRPGGPWEAVVGANSPTFSRTAALADNGIKYRVRIYVPGATATSSVALLTVVHPNTPPVYTKGPNPMSDEDTAVVLPGFVTGIEVHNINRTPVSVSYDFSAVPPGATTSNRQLDAPSAVPVVRDGILKLTDAVNGSTGTLLTGPLPITVDSFTISFKMRMGGGTCCGAALPDGSGVSRPADGLSLSIGEIPTPLAFIGGAAEEGAVINNGLSVNIDTWDNNGADEAPALDVKVGGNVIAFQSLAGEREGGRATAGPLVNDPATGNPLGFHTGPDFVDVVVHLDPDGTLDVDLKNVRVINNIQTGLDTFSNGRLAFGARTGGANNNQWVDDVSITAFPQDSSSAEFGQTVQFKTSNNHSNLFSVQPEISPTGTLTYTPAPNACGTATVTVVAMDNGGTAFGGDDTADPMTFVITVKCLNDCPTVPTPILVSVNEDGSVAISIASSDVDGDTLSYGLTSAANGGISGTIPNLIYTPNPNYCGPDGFTFSVSDGICTVNGTVSINVICQPDPPVCHAEISPLCYLGAGVTGLIAIADDNTNATVVLDASLSSSPEGAPLTFQWFIDGALVGTGAVHSNSVNVGTHQVALIVTANGASCTQILTLEVLTPCDAIEELMDLINSSTVARKKKKPLLSHLKKACAEYEKYHFDHGDKKLEDFEKKVRKDIARDYPTEAADWIRISECIREATARGNFKRTTKSHSHED